MVTTAGDRRAEPMSIEIALNATASSTLTTMPNATFQPTPPAGNCHSNAGQTTKERREPRTNSSAASYAFSPKPQGISDEKGHYDQSHQIENAIHALLREYESALSSAANRAPT
jgi:hypothetical protein